MNSRLSVIAVSEEDQRMFLASPRDARQVSDLPLSAHRLQLVYDNGGSETLEQGGFDQSGGVSGVKQSDADNEAATASRKIPHSKLRIADYSTRSLPV